MDWAALLGEADRKLLMFSIKAVETSHRERDRNRHHGVIPHFTPAGVTLLLPFESK